MSATTLLDRLEGVRQTGPGRWIARCPAHKDRRPSLSVREIDGRTLIHCFGGCGSGDVLGAVGLRMTDMFERPVGGSGPAGGFARSHSRIPAADALAALDHEITVAAMILSDAREDIGTFNAANLTRLQACARRIGAIRDLCCPLEVRHAG
ncbi:MAG: CHC2 zinc finger domain-containing protein [Thiomonas sp.]